MTCERSVPSRLPIIAVIGSGTNAHEDRAVSLGRALANLDVHLLTGGGDGVMSTVSQAFHGVALRTGLVIGILPGCDGAPHPGYPNQWVEVPIQTHLPLSGNEGTQPMSRNHLIILSADAVIALPGGAGTSSEVQLAGQYGRPAWAHLDSADQVPDLPSSVPVVPQLDDLIERVQQTLLTRS